MSAMPHESHARVSYPEFGTPPVPARVEAVCEAMGWDTGMGYSEGIPQGGVIAAHLLDDLRGLGWELVRTNREEDAS